MYHEHPLKILRYSIKNIWLLIFPIIRGIRYMQLSRDWFYEWIKGAWFDILIVGAIILFGLVRWYFSYVDITDTSVIHKEGFLFRFRTEIPYSSISSYTVEKPFYLALFNAMKVRCDTSAGVFKTSDMKFMIGNDVCAELIKHFPKIDEKQRITSIKRPTALSIILFSVFFSSGFTGTAYIALFFYKGGSIARTIIGTSFSKIAEETSKLSNRLLLRIPDAAATAAAVFIGTWLMSFVMNLLRYARFEAASDAHTLKTSYGTLTRREHTMKISHINYTDLRQNLIMKLFGAVAVHVSCSGYGSGRGLPVLTPVQREKNMSRELERIGVFSSIKNEVRPKATGYWQYVWMPVIASLALPLIYIMSSKVKPEFSDLTLFVFVMAEIPAVWMILVKTAAFFTSGISVYDDRIMIRCCHWTFFHTIFAERSKLVKVELIQSIPQRIGGRCTVAMWFEGEENKGFKVRALPTHEAIKITELLDHKTAILLENGGKDAKKSV